MYGEWMYAKHKIFYDALPHYFIEFDILDRENGKFLDTPRRLELLSGSPIVSAPTLYSGEYRSEREVLSLLGNSAYISENHKENLTHEAERLGLDPVMILAENEGGRLAEGLYLKVEDGGYVTERMKYVRSGYIQQKTSDTPWHSRPIIENKLAPGVSLY